MAHRLDGWGSLPGRLPYVSPTFSTTESSTLSNIAHPKPLFTIGAIIFDTLRSALEEHMADGGQPALWAAVPFRPWWSSHRKRSSRKSKEFDFIEPGMSGRFDHLLYTDNKLMANEIWLPVEPMLSQGHIARTTVFCGLLSGHSILQK